MRLIGAVRGICSLWLSGVEFNITAMMGMVMIIGIATAMGHLVSEFQALARKATTRGSARSGAQSSPAHRYEYPRDDDRYATAWCGNQSRTQR